MSAQIPPLGHIGIIGGGQLGRMLSVAAAKFGYKVTIFCPEDNCPAAQVAGRQVVADYDDEAALVAFAQDVDVVTLEFENIPVKALELASTHTPIAPGVESLRVSQDRLVEKTYIADLGIDVAPFAAFDDAASLEAAFAEIGRPAIAKTRRFGYDGKGQVPIKSKRDFDDVLDAMAGAPAILEKMIDFETEISVVVARSATGDVAAYPIGENVHREGTLRTTTVPANITDAQEAKAKVIAARIANALDHIGVLTVELFVAVDGSLIVNEIAPRVHNSGHWTIEGATTSQFEQHIRAICGLPLGPARALGWTEMTNLLGADILEHQRYLADESASFHHYGKSDPRPGRKMGHVTRVVRD